jgi:hypothetical protein
MSLPTDWTLIPVHGHWINLSGNPEQGTITFTPSCGPLVDAASNTIILPKDIVVPLDANGEINTTLPATDDPDITGQPFGYAVTVRTSKELRFGLTLPIGTIGTIELSAVTPVSSPPSLPSTFIQSINGKSGILTNQDLNLPPDWIVLSTSQAAAAGTAINNAIATLGTNGGTIYLAKGTWTLDTAIQISQSGIVIQGASPSGTLLQFDASVVPTAIKMADTTQRWGVLRDFRMATTSGTTGQGTAIDASYFTNFSIERLRIGSTGQAPNMGIVFNALGSYYNHVRDVRVTVAGTSSVGIKFDTTSNSNLVQNARIIGDANTTGVYVNAHSIELNRVDIESNCLFGIDVAAAGHECLILHPYLESVSGTGLRLASGVQAVSVVGGFITSSGTANITDNGSVSFVAANVRLQFAPYNFPVMSGAGAPGGSVSAPTGAVYRNTNGGANTTLYVKESGTGTAGWIAK